MKTGFCGEVPHRDSSEMKAHGWLYQTKARFREKREGKGDWLRKEKGAENHKCEGGGKSEVGGRKGGAFLVRKNERKRKSGGNGANFFSLVLEMDDQAKERGSMDENQG